MKKFRDFTLKNKLTVIIMLASTAAIFFVGVTTLGVCYFVSRRALVQDLVGLTQIIGSNCSAAITFNIPEDAERILSALKEKPTVIAAEIFDRDQKTFAAYYKDGLVRRPRIRLDRINGHYFTENFVTVVSSIRVNKDEIAKIAITDNMNDISERVMFSANILGLVILMALLAAFVISARLQKLISEPILALVRTASRVSTEQDFSIRAEKTTEDEMGRFIDAFNDMLSQIQQRDEALQKSSKILKDAERLAHIGSWEYDFLQNRLVWSDEFYRLLGLEPEEVLPSHEAFAGFVHAEDRVRLSQEFVKKGEPSEVEYRLITKGGNQRNIYARSIQERDAAGNTVKASGIILDITERKKAESEREWLSAILHSTSDLVAMASPDGKITYMNDAGRRMLGLAPKESLGDRNLGSIHPKWALAVILEQGIPAAVKNGVWTGETALLDNDGVAVPVSQVIMSHKKKDGSLEYLSTIMRDMTERRKAETEMNRLRNYLKNIIDSMPSILVSVDAEGHITNWNAEAEKVTGITPKKAEGKVLSDIFPQFGREFAKVKEAMSRRETRKDQKVENIINGERRYLDVTIYPLVANGVDGAVIRADDVTDRVRIEEMMVQSEKMLSVGGLAAGMAHEINNPLAGILQNVQVMKNRISPELPRNRKVAEACGVTIEGIAAYMEKRGFSQMVDAVMASGRRAARIVENMLSFSRKSVSGYEPRDLRRLLDSTVMLISNDYDFKQQYDFKKIKIVREYDRDAEVVCEGNKIQQVFLNVLKNGAQAMMHNEAKSNPPQFTLRIRSESDRVITEIEDNGAGMTEDVCKRVFEPFYTTKGVGQGTGLGLSVSYFIIVDDHDGTMACESEPGKGTRFIITLNKSAGFYRKNQAEDEKAGKQSAGSVRSENSAG